FFHGNSVSTWLSTKFVSGIQDSRICSNGSDLKEVGRV
ncbi:hypothetical protein Csa_023793, partial [Cucumis sativus]